MDYGQLALATMAMNQESVWSQWGKVLIPAILGIVATAGTGFVVYWLTTRKEKQERKRREGRVESIGDMTWLRLTNIVNAVPNVLTKNDIQKLVVRLEGVCEYCELVTGDALEFNFGPPFYAFIRLKNSAVKFRDELKVLESNSAYQSALLNKQKNVSDAAARNTVARITGDLAEYEQNYLTTKDGNKMKNLIGMDI